MSSPKIVAFDLETIPNWPEARHHWPSLSNYPGLTLRAQINSIVCFGYKIIGQDVKCLNAWDYKIWSSDINDDSALIRDAYEILKDSDALITHNGNSFDLKVLQTRILIHGMNPLPKIPMIDTKNLMKSNLTLYNNKLVTAAEALTNERKQEHKLGWDLWVRVMDRDQEAMDIMEAYCKQDVVALEALYHRLRPFIKNMPNHNLFAVGEQRLCPTCGSSRIISEGIRANKTSTYRRMVCHDCGSRSKEPMNRNLPRSE